MLNKILRKRGEEKTDKNTNKYLSLVINLDVNSHKTFSKYLKRNFIVSLVEFVDDYVLTWVLAFLKT